MKPFAPVLPILAGLALAKSGHARGQFRVDAGAPRLVLVQGPGAATVGVNPFGSDRCGAALVRLSSGAGKGRMMCIPDKARKTAKLCAQSDG
ncbi:MAG: hypothetical protein IOD05_01270 [Rhodobacter sp.]|nr:hypothetical protein [Rhodobacter sp.]MCA3491955.1 hypothetical protein [Rhodobacter sp.]MCA3500946.1 hypothetical protein [Rhodobacter sp.]MCA3501904.1 hypothetical protein [Rhodobacter sp.]MCA3515360.1 hypothetical protein [Rhodobacter sp.]